MNLHGWIWIALGIGGAFVYGGWRVHRAEMQARREAARLRLADWARGFPPAGSPAPLPGMSRVRTPDARMVAEPDDSGTGTFI
jgi:hypothetical protein